MRLMPYLSTGLFTLALSALTWTSSLAAPAPVTVKISNFTFDAPTVTVPAGTTVTWVNQDDEPHTVTSDDRVTVQSKVLDTRDSFSFTFAAPGTFAYFCSIHPHMTGKVVVVAP